MPGSSPADSAYVGAANNLLAAYDLPELVTRVGDCRSFVFVDLVQQMLGCTISDLVDGKLGDAEQCEAAIRHLAAVVGRDLGYITGEAIEAGDRDAIVSLLDVLLEIHAMGAPAAVSTSVSESESLSSLDYEVCDIIGGSSNGGRERYFDDDTEVLSSGLGTVTTNKQAMSAHRDSDLADWTTQPSESDSLDSPGCLLSAERGFAVAQSNNSLSAVSLETSSEDDEAVNTWDAGHSELSQRISDLMLKYSDKSVPDVDRAQQAAAKPASAEQRIRGLWAAYRGDAGISSISSGSVTSSAPMTPENRDLTTSSVSKTHEQLRRKPENAELRNKLMQHILLSQRSKNAAAAAGGPAAEPTRAVKKAQSSRHRRGDGPATSRLSCEPSAPAFADEFPGATLSSAAQRQLWAKYGAQKQAMARNVLDAARRPPRTSPLDAVERRHRERVKIIAKDVAVQDRLVAKKEREHRRRQVAIVLQEQRRASIQLRKHCEQFRSIQRSKENRRKARDDIVIRELFEQSMAEYRERLRAAELYARDMRKAHEKKEADVVASFANWYEDQVEMLDEEVFEKNRRNDRDRREDQRELGRLRQEVRRQVNEQLVSLEDQLFDVEDLAGDLHARSARAALIRS